MKLGRKKNKNPDMGAVNVKNKYGNHIIGIIEYLVS
jgi:hypothetical protein